LSVRDRTLSRDVVATRIPSGEKQLMQAGSRLVVHQKLGGSFTVQTETGLFRIDSRDAEALGEAVAEAPAAQNAPSADGSPDPEAIWEQLRQVYDPEIPVNIVDLGLVYSMDVSPLPSNAGFKVDVAMTLTAPGCGMGPAIADDARGKVMAVPGVAEADVRITWDPPWNQSMISEEGKMKLGLI
jgi:probable FeS assembly SUF system protein SufT